MTKAARRKCHGCHKRRICWEVDDEWWECRKCINLEMGLYRLKARAAFAARASSRKARKP